MSADRAPRRTGAIGAHRVLAVLLAALALLFASWFHDDARPLAALAVFALPPALLAIGAALGRRHAVFWSGVFGLGWFCHGVMLAFDRPGERGHALAEVLLALAIIVASSWPGLSARFARGRRGTSD
jgi:uncharacterized membrane protein